MPRDILLDPPVSTWATAASLTEALATDAPDRVVAVPLMGGDHENRALRELGLDPEVVLATHEPSREAGALTAVALAPGAGPARRLLLAGLGSGDDVGTDAWRRAGAAVGRATRGRDTTVHVLEGGSVDGVAAWVEGAVLGGWGSPRWTRDGATAPVQPARTGVVVAAEPALTAVPRAVTAARAQLIARSLAATPSNTKNPGWLADRARTLARGAGLDVRVWDEKALRSEGFGGLLAVGAGSPTPPRLVQLGHTPAGSRAGTPHVVLVGKGITFDTGGIQVKPTDGMLGMKTDMSGAAVVLAVLAACRDLAVPVRVTGLLALAENSVDGASYRPGDVVTQYGGTTVEIGNTDAEGRIVLADALAYADAHLDPDVVVDIATLTGAARVALGRTAAPVYATDDALADALLQAGATSGETLWRMPLAETYRRALDSDVADLTHIAPGVGGGSVTAALFLREFVGARRWAHLDIAGTGRSDVDAGIHSKGGTGFGTRLLLRWLEEAR